MKSAAVFILLFFTVTALSAQQEFKSPEDLKAWLPAEIAGYAEDADNHASEQQLQGKLYFIAAKQYKKSQEAISIVIIDYRTSVQVITSVTSAWEDGKEVNNELIQSKNITIGNNKAKEIYDKKNNSSQLYVYHNDQYLITVSMKGDYMDLLKQVITNLPFSRLP
ncbi:hypothetical protein SanaruYs_27640 [Chryseotalea sanaruensis]|uniref:DUF4367 domain-containing protein n=1 Tax=Chryseotalea sanaruensis TaxID=2482724 RepID=A0A401UCB2_9BACT|nr:hypothetical protein [Chryseotalea sanaruensis]GCC52527.1 hypothetical protein SanaruYs_27640 [Chryseotalea sanaruensis]